MKLKNKNTIILEKDIKHLIDKYLANRQNDLKEIKIAIKKEDFNAIQKIAHGIKGSGGCYGLDELSLLGEQLEKATLRQSKEEVLVQTSLLRQYLSKLNIKYE
jgi:HPt (histidine-containing phosphotransfer) domain-containing protein